MCIGNPDRKLVFMLTVLSFLLAPAFASENKGISKDFIKKIQSDLKMNRTNRALYNAVSGSDIKQLAVNRDLLRNHNDFYSDKIDVKSITNQKASGRCWLFATLNSLRPYVIEKNNLKDFKFSQIYLSFWDKFEKANTFYENIIRLRQRDLLDRELVFQLKKPIGDGGYFENARNLIEKYGAVPREVMPETRSSENTKIMNVVLDRKLRVDAVKLRKMASKGMPVEKLREAKEKMLSDVYRILVMNMGQPPVKFDWRYKPKSVDDDDDDKAKDCNKDKSIIVKDLTPKKFYDEFVGVDLSEYVDLANAAPHQLGKLYHVGMSKNMYDGDPMGFVNVSLETIKKIAIKSIKDGSPMYFSAEVSIDQDNKKGLMAKSLYDYESLFGIDLQMNRKELAMYREAAPVHAMNLIGVDIQESKPVKWLVENSWGTARGDKGFWTMYDDWFDENVFAIVVKKKYVPRKILKIFEQDPVKLPAWDPIW